MVDRRTVLLAAPATVLGLAAPARAAAVTDPAPFCLGVASGDPDASSVILWTRVVSDVTEPDTGGIDADRVPVTWEVAYDTAFRHVVRRGTAYADVAAAHTVHVTVTGLVANRWYYYRFTALGHRSRIGRTRTLPPANQLPRGVRFAVVSCQNWTGGRYRTYADLAAQDLDFVVHLGDYIYETNTGSLTEFRRLHMQYKTSPDLRAAHARFPFFLTWDDHEVQNNYAGTVPSLPGDGRPFPERRANGYQAYFEHLPIRHRANVIYRRAAVGSLLEMSVLDTRQYRSDQACGDWIQAPCGDEAAPGRTMTGPAQERWLLDGLARSRARWNVVAQQTMMAPFDYDPGPGREVNMDQWDGYPAARSRILGRLRTTRNPVVLSGDWHTNWVNDLDIGARTVATEFVGTSVSSEQFWDDAVRAALAGNPHVRFYDGTRRGYLICEVTPDRWRTRLRVVASPSDPTADAWTLATYDVTAGRPGAHRA